MELIYTAKRLKSVNLMISCSRKQLRTSMAVPALLLGNRVLVGGDFRDTFGDNHAYGDIIWQPLK